MSRLHHFSFSPFCRKVRLALSEKRIETAWMDEYPWEGGPERRSIAPTLAPPANQVPDFELPIFVERGGRAISGDAAIIEYLEEARPDPALLPPDPVARAEARRIANWFDRVFHGQVTSKLLNERMFKKLRDGEPPDSGEIRAGVAALRKHLVSVGTLAAQRRWLAGDHLSIADLAAAAHLSTLDYTGDIAWEDQPSAKDWYARIKSRPAFRDLLADRIPGMPPAPHYADLDF